MSRLPCTRLRLLVCLLGIAAALSAAPAKATGGVMALADLGFAPAEAPAAEYTLGALELAVAAVAAQATDPELATLLASVSSFHLRQYTPPVPATVAAAETLLARLVSEGWKLARLEVQDSRRLSVYARAGATGIEGLVVVAIDPEREVTLACVGGDIDPLQLISRGLAILP
jgi:hypothetical protein